MSRLLSPLACVCSPVRPPARSHAGGRAVWLAASMLLPLSVWSQAEPPAAAVIDPPLIQSVDVGGSNPLSPDDTQAVVQRFLNQPANLSTLSALTAALGSALRAQGYGLYKVTLPEQALGTQLRLEVVRFKLNQLDVQGQQHVDAANALHGLPELQPGQSPNLHRLTLQTQLVNRLAHKQVRVGLRESPTPDSVDATVVVADRSPWAWGIEANNTGLPATGRDRVTFQAMHHNLFNQDHTLGMVWTTSAERSDDVQQWGVSYRIPLYRLSGVLSASLSQSDVMGRFGAFSSNGAGRTFQLGYNQLMAASGRWTGDWSLNFNDRRYNGVQLLDANGNPIGSTATPDTRSRTLSLGTSGLIGGSGTSARYSLSGSVALPGGRGNNLAAYNNSGTNPAITTAHWQALRGSSQVQVGLPAQWLLSWRSEAQLSPNALIPGEQFGLGGSTSVRGIPERALQGDQGLQTTLELRSPSLRPNLNLLLFTDMGWLHNRNRNGSTRLASDQVASLGLGLRWVSASGLALSADYGYVVTSSRLSASAAPDAPKTGDERVHVSLSLRF